MDVGDENLYLLAATGGLIVLHASQVQPKNTSSVLISNLLGIAFATIAYWGCGYAFAVGNAPDPSSSSNFFLSHTRFFLMDATEPEFALFANTLCKLLLVIVICNSGFVSRMRCWIYPIIIVIIAGFLYPCVYHWIYHPDGWLKEGIDVVDSPGKERKLLFMDEGMVGLIHIFGGSCALIGTIIIGTRKERNDKKFAALGGNLNPLIVVGGILAVVGLLAKNLTLSTEHDAASNAKMVDYAYNKNIGAKSSISLINTLLSAQGSAIVAFTLKRTKICGDPSGTKALINGALAGVVGVSCACHMYHPYGALVIGVVSGLAYTVWTALFQCCRIDDPTDSAAVHLGAGVWGALAAPLFRRDSGLIYSQAENYRFELFGWQILGVLAIFVWAGLTLFIVFLPFILCKVSTYEETDIQQGLDAFELDDPAFPDKSQYSSETDNILEDIIPVSTLPSGYITKSSYENPVALQQTMWDTPEQDWRLAQY